MDKENVVNIPVRMQYICGKCVALEVIMLSKIMFSLYVESMFK